MTLPFSLPTLPLAVRANILAFLPKISSPIMQRIPFSWQQKALIPALSSIFNEALVDGDFEFLQNRWLCIEITDLKLNWLISYHGEKLIMADVNEDRVADVTFSASGDDLLLIAGRQQDPDTLFFQRRLKIEGDTELGLEVKNLIDALDIDQLPNKVHFLVKHMSHWVNESKTLIEASKKQASSVPYSHSLINHPLK